MTYSPTPASKPSKRNNYNKDIAPPLTFDLNAKRDELIWDVKCNIIIARAIRKELFEAWGLSAN